MAWKISTMSFVLLLSALTVDAGADAIAAIKKSPLVIGHRGASGHRPEHTLASYQLAIEMGADYIEPDLVMTKDKVLVARHENEISETTDAASKFPDKKTTKTVDGQEITGWFIEDLTLAELKTLKANERLKFRNNSYDGKFEVPTLAEILTFVKEKSLEHNREIGIYPETKHPTYFRSIGLPLEEALIAELEKFDMNKKDSKVFIQSFELSNLKMLKKLTPLPLVFLVGGAKEVPYDHVVANNKTTYGDMMKPAYLKELSATVAGIGPDKRLIVPTGLLGILKKPTTLVKDAHAAGLLVHPYTFRNEKQFLHLAYRGDPQKEYLQFYKLGVDGLFSDFTDEAVKARKTFMNENSKDKKNEKN
jgi:glycerophosphoryl diester phosphodiesterase